MRDRPPPDLDAALRLADLASHHSAKVADIALLFETAAKDRAALSKQASAGKAKHAAASLLYVATRNSWESDRLAAEARFLASLAKSVSTGTRKKSKIA